MIRVISIPLLILSIFLLLGRRRKHIDFERKKTEFYHSLGSRVGRKKGGTASLDVLKRLVVAILGRLENKGFISRIKNRAVRLGPGAWEKLIYYWSWGTLLTVLSVTAVFQSLALSFIVLFLCPFFPSPILTLWEIQYGRRMREETRHFITLVSGTLRAGLSLTTSFEEALGEIEEPLSGEIRVFLDSVRLGAPVDDALKRLGGRVGDPDLDFLLTAITTVRSAGGDLVRVMSAIEDTVRERIELEEEVRVLTTQGRASGVIVAALPVLFLLLLFVISRESVAVLTTTLAGFVILGVGALLEFVGFLWIRRLTHGERRGVKSK